MPMSRSDGGRKQGTVAPEGASQDEARRYAQAILRTMRQPLIVLNGGLRVQTANRAFYEAFQVGPDEIEGRPIYELGNGQWDIPKLRELLEILHNDGAVVENFKVEHEFEHIGRRVMILNAHELKRETQANSVLLAIEDITAEENARSQLEAEKKYSEGLVDTFRDALLVLDFDLRVKSANASFYQTFKVEPHETEGRTIYELGDGQWDIPRLRELLDEILPDNPEDVPPESFIFNDLEVDQEFERIGRRIMVLNARRVDHMQVIVLAIDDQTEERRGAAALAESEARYRTLFESMDEGFCIMEVLFDDSGTPVDYRFCEVNPAFVRHTGLEGAVGTRISELAPDNEQRWFDIYGRVALTGEPERFEQPARQLGRWFDAYAFRVGEPEQRRVAVVFRDVSDQKAAAAALSESEAKFRALVESTAHATWETDPSGVIVEDSPSWRAMTGQALEEWLGSGWADAVHPDDRKYVVPEWRETLAAESPVDAEFRIRRAEGGWRWVHVRAAPVRDGNGRIVRWVGMNIDITDRKRAEERAEYLALHDTLTGLPNRACFADRLAEAIARAKKNDSNVGLVLFDLDRFKTINDTFGHLAGDTLLRIVTERLRSAMRRGDTPARIGGDEFAAILPDIGHTDEIGHLAKRICETIIGPASIEGQTFEAAASFGVASFPGNADGMGTLMRNADLALYKAKADGRHHICHFDESLARAAMHRTRVEAELRRAIKCGDLALAYQPQFDLRTGAVRSVEALVRWQHEERGLILPGEFIGIAEASGAIRPLGEWIMNEACRQQAIWRAEGHDITMAVNVSPAEANHDDFSKVVDRALDRADLEGSALELEITEGLLIQHESRSVRAFLDGCRKRGVCLAIDDFGVGYSSFGYLKRLPIAKIKIDRSFVCEIGRSEDDTLIEAMIDLGHRLGKRVVAEGIETREQLDYLRAAGCDDVQGYLLCAPEDPQTVKTHFVIGLT